jgi:hypothetical protein
MSDVERILREHGLTDQPATYDSDIHSWRCGYPAEYGPCDCFQSLTADLAAHVAAAEARGAARALEDAADAVDAESERVGGMLAGDCTDWLRAAAVRADQGATGEGRCHNRGPRIGEDGTRCRRPAGHDGQHATAPEDGFGTVTW